MARGHKEKINPIERAGGQVGQYVRDPTIYV